MNTTTNTRVSEAMVEQAERGWYSHIGEHGLDGSAFRDRLRAALEAALSAEPAAQGEAVAWQYRRLDEEEGPSPYWHHMTREQYEMFRDNPRSNCEVRQLFTAPPTQPAERVPEAKTEDYYAEFGTYEKGHMTGWNDCRRAMLAATLRQNPERGVTEAMVAELRDEATRQHGSNYADDLRDLLLRAAAALEAALSAEPAAQGEAVAEVVEHEMDDGYLIPKRARLLRDLPAGTKLYTATPAEPAAQGEAVATVKSWTNGSYHRNYVIEWHRNVNAGTKLYTAPPAQPAERVPEGWTAWHDDVARTWAVRSPAGDVCEVHDRAGDVHAEVLRQLAQSIAATPTAPAEEGDGKPSEGWKGVDGLCIRNPAPNAAAPSTALSPTATVYLNAKDAR